MLLLIRYLVVLACSVLIFTGCNNHSASDTIATTAHSNHQPSPAATEVAQRVPHFFDDPDKAKPFPKTLDPGQFKHPAQKKAYETARRIPEVLAQQPCYCFCDQGFGHGSLLDCHIDKHSAD
jgi:hypothetical protein